MPINTHKVAVPVSLFRTLLPLGFSAQDLRFLLAIYAHCEDQSLVPSIHGNEPPEEMLWAEAIELRKMAGFGSDNGNRSLKRFIAKMLVTDVTIFVELGLSADSKYLLWRFRKAAWQGLEQHKYLNADWALVSLHETKHLRTAEQALLYLEFKALRNATAPAVRLTHLPPEHQKFARWKVAVQKICQLLDCRCFVGFERGPEKIKRTSILLRIVHDKTTWHPNALKKWAPATQVYYVDGDQALRVRDTGSSVYEGAGIDPNWRPTKQC